MKQIPKALFIVGLPLILAVVYFALKPATIVVVNPDSTLSPEAARKRFSRHAKEMSPYPPSATSAAFYLEPGNYETTDIHGEYLKFQAPIEAIEAYIDSEIGLTNKTETPSSYSQWHWAIGDQQWYRPDTVEAPEHYEKKERMMTFDRTNKTLYYSSVLRGLVTDALPGELDKE